MQTTSFKAKYRVTIFRASEGFRVCMYRNLETGKNVKCIGNDLPETSAIAFILNGSFETDKQHGEQFRVTSFTEEIEQTKDGILAYLSSGLLKGVGKKTAERIYKQFGDKTLEILKDSPEELLRVRGITSKKMLTIAESYAENHIPKELIDLLLPRGFRTTDVVKIYKKYGVGTMQIIQQNPYDLCAIKGISFGVVDRLKEYLQIPQNDPRRVRCATMEALKQIYYKGYVAATFEQLIQKTGALTGIDDHRIIWPVIRNMAMTGDIEYRKGMYRDKMCRYFYLPGVKTNESRLAMQIIRLMSKPKDDSKKAEKAMREMGSQGIDLDLAQTKAVSLAFENPFSIITGGPGVGKTTIIKKIVDINQKIHPRMEIALLAPTGKAARRITETTQHEAKTIHSCFHIKPYDNDVQDCYHEDDSPLLDKCLVIVDEFSMVDMSLALFLFEHLNDCRVVIVGDPDQLQSVGAGDVLRDMIDSGVIPMTKLSYVHRQGDESTININAHGIQNGKASLDSAPDFICEYTGRYDTETLKAIEDRMVTRYLEYTSDPDISSVICLCPFKKYEAGIYSLNSRLQNILNPPQGAPDDQTLNYRGHEGMVFRRGDPVMHIKTNTEDASNGNTGIVKDIRKVDGILSVIVEYDLGNRHSIVAYGPKEIDQLILAYAMTVHKSQGSEYDAVVTCMTKAHGIMKRRNIMYTAMTRAKKKVAYYFDTEETTRSAIFNNSVDERNTLLDVLLREQYEKGEQEKEKVDDRKTDKTDGDDKGFIQLTLPIFA